MVYIDSDITTRKAEPFSGGNLNELLSTFGTGPPRWCLASAYSMLLLTSRYIPNFGMYPFSVTLVKLVASRWLGRRNL